MRIERRMVKVKVEREGDLCPQWPNCRRTCAVQGYLNLNEEGHCGKKPKTRRVVNEEQVE